MVVRKAAVSLILVALVAVSLGCISSTATSNDALAKCLTSKGVKMYGAYWCPHCQNQEKAFGSSFQHIAYVECDPKGPSPDPEACKAAGIRGYPAWVIWGVQYPGERSLEELAKIAGC